MEDFVPRRTKNGSLFRRLVSFRLSLRRLFVYVTMICVVSGAIAQYPDAVAAVGRHSWSMARLALLVAPSLLAGAWYAQHSSNPRLSFFVTTCGGSIGVFLSPGLSANAERIALWALGVPWRLNSAHDIGLMDLCIPPLVALLAGGIDSYLRIGTTSNAD